MRAGEMKLSWESAYLFQTQNLKPQAMGIKYLKIIDIFTQPHTRTFADFDPQLLFLSTNS